MITKLILLTDIDGMTQQLECFGPEDYVAARTEKDGTYLYTRNEDYIGPFKETPQDIQKMLNASNK